MQSCRASRSSRVWHKCCVVSKVNYLYICKHYTHTHTHCTRQQTNNLSVLYYCNIYPWPSQSKCVGSDFRLRCVYKGHLLQTKWERESYKCICIGLCVYVGMIQLNTASQYIHLSVCVSLCLSVRVKRKLKKKEAQWEGQKRGFILHTLILIK